MLYFIIFVLQFSVLFQLFKRLRLLRHTTSSKAVRRITAFGSKRPHIDELLMPCFAKQLLGRLNRPTRDNEISGEFAFSGSRPFRGVEAMPFSGMTPIRRHCSRHLPTLSHSYLQHLMLRSFAFRIQIQLP
jgi:hypothetical protein